LFKPSESRLDEDESYKKMVKRETLDEEDMQPRFDEAAVPPIQRLSEGVHLVNAKKACTALMSEIVQKTFHAKVSSVIKRYHSMFLARGGKEASRSSLREVRKQEGLGSQKKQKIQKQPTNSYKMGQ
jgi:hypothetical protein